MIAKLAHFVNDIYLPQAKPSVTDPLVVENKVNDFIQDYENDCLLKCLGYTLFNEFIANVLPDGTWDTGTPIKWDKLLTGDTVTADDGSTLIWKGITHQNVNVEKCLIAQYVYIHFESDDHITRSLIGDVVEEGENSLKINPTQKVVKAWNVFVDWTEGLNSDLIIGSSAFGEYVDWSSGSTELSLYQYINFMNDLDATTYAFFKPKRWKRINEFGI